MSSPSSVHPKQLVARDVMSPDPVCAEASMSLEDFARLLDDDEISGAPVIDGGGAVVAVVSRTDLMRHLGGLGEGLEAGRLFELLMRSDDERDDAPLGRGVNVRVEDFMSGDPIVCGPDEPLPAIARRMCEARVHRVVVVDADRHPVGIVTSMDLVRALADA